MKTRLTSTLGLSLSLSMLLGYSANILADANTNVNGDKQVIIHLSSKHSDAGYNESNPGLGFRTYDSRWKWSWGIGFYQNSLNHTSMYAGATKEVLSSGILSLRLSGGLITGYAKDVAPFVIPEIGVSLSKKVSGIVSYIPAVEFGDLKTVGAIGFSLEMEL